MDLKNKEVQADLPIIDSEETKLKIRPAERVRLHPKVPIEPSSYGKGKSYSRPWILQDGREVPEKGSVMRDSFKIPRKSNAGQGKLLLPLIVLTYLQLCLKNTIFCAQVYGSEC